MHRGLAIRRIALALLALAGAAGAAEPPPWKVDCLLAMREDPSPEVARQAEVWFRVHGAADPRLFPLALEVFRWRRESPPLAEAVWKLAALSGHLPEMMPFLEDENAAVIDDAAAGLALAPEVAHSVAPQVLPLLMSPRPEVRSRMILPMLRSGLKASEARNYLLPLLHDPDDEVRATAMGLLPQSPLPLPEVLRELRKALADPAAGVSPVVALGRLGPKAAEAGPELLALLREPKDPRAFAASQALGKVGGSAKGLVPALFALVHDESWPVHRNAMVAIENLNPAAEVLLPRLRPLLDDSPEDVQVWAVEMLTRLGPAGQGLERDLRSLLHSTSEEVRRSAATALGGLKTLERASVAGLLASANDPNPYVRAAAVATLGRAGLRTPETAQAFKSSESDASPLVREAAAEALAASGVAAAIPDLLAVLDSARDDDELPPAFQALANFGEQVKDYWPDVTARLQAERPEARAAAVKLIARLEPDEEKVLPALVTALQDHASLVRETAFAALLHSRGAEGKAVPRLVALLSVDKPEVAPYAALLLFRLGYERPDLIPLLGRSFGNGYTIGIAYTLADVTTPQPALSWYALQAKAIGPAYLLAEMTPERKEALRWLGGRPPELLPDLPRLTPEARAFAVRSLQAALEATAPNAADLGPLRAEIADRLRELAADPPLR